MRNRTVNSMLVVFLLISVGGAADTVQTDSALRIYLPREITIEGDVPNLGQVAIIRGEKGLAAKAGEVTLGRISAPGQKIIVDRSVVLSRLACSGIDVSAVTLTGAEKIMVSRQYQIITGAEFVEKASAFLKMNPPDASICQWNPIRIPKDFILPGLAEDIQLSPCFIKSGIINQTKVRIAVFSNGKEVAARQVTFGLKYNCRKLVTQVDIPAGGVISPGNVKIEKSVSNYPEPGDWAVPYGFVAKRLLPAKTVIRRGMVGPVKPKLLLKRNQNVVIKVDKLGLVVTAIGKTMQEGRAGEYIKVRNVDSNRIILVRVNEDQTVEPVF